ncbi:hypothetical protein A2625_02930 [candidate division WOR-1 bacterium RIFCSPHIGHO2_01_FULL_53_15]|uniref:Uncharacterized protein n=1 Tax=candidate division WOR-1 bacterium RIFCSPHIGHO2_01_FULL_53_15 TaxID=1802564 RepID=A0A1F4Q2R6_UNCSA|nr:MAG: hypothetical protein A2625_02930 [candidate division WOR-1 bacterium RIFCSPHIGHO2_01_FULL_53_15]OGC10383.1 MAG: hypothetical protein A3D23_07615 [candidate division WOR-1 bacterium RIFCSPHIGHO2_02_FULL_53_26]
MAVYLYATAAITSATADQAEPFIVFHDLKDAFSQVLRSNPEALGVGEYHPTESAPAADPAIKFFADPAVLNLLKQHRYSDLVIETWTTDGKCHEEKVIMNKLDRPDNIIAKIDRLIRNSKNTAINPHIMKISCSDFNLILIGPEIVDYPGLLSLMREKMMQNAQGLLAKKSKFVLYGGALTNDLFPNPGDRNFTYGEQLAQATINRYVEVDLLVPEFIQNDEGIKKQSWYKTYLKSAPKNKVIMFNPKPNQFIIILPRTT